MFLQKLYLKNIKIFAIYYTLGVSGNFIYLKNQINLLHRYFFFLTIFFFSKNISGSLIKILFFFSSRCYKIFGFFIHTPISLIFFPSYSLLTSVFFFKDVDGIAFKNQYLSYFFRPKIFSCVVKGILYFLKDIKINLNGLNVVLISSSATIGLPLYRELIFCGCSVVIFKELSTKVCFQLLQADIVITAYPNFSLFCSFELKQNVIIIDVGTLVKKKKLIGNFSFLTQFFKRGYKTIYTPTPGGVGIFTLLCFVQNSFLLLQKS